MGLQGLFRTRSAGKSGEALYAAAVAQARDPAFYRTLGAPDTVEGRFEVYALHVCLLIHRLKDKGDAAKEVSQGLFDSFVAALDHGLREMGVGDTKVGKKMRRLAEAFFGRARAYDEVLTGKDRPELEALVGRTVLDGTDADPAPLAAYVAAAAEALDAQPLDGFLQGRVTWPAAT